jgi:Spy/CpxP family protein refolding chaperone
MKSISLLAVILCMFICGQAQQKRDTIRDQGKQHAEKVKLKQELDLNKKQVGQIKEVRKNYKKNLSSIEADSTLSKEQQKQKRKQLILERQQKTDSLLTPEQRIKARELMKEKRKDRKGKKESGEMKKDDT